MQLSNIFMYNNHNILCSFSHIFAHQKQLNQRTLLKSAGVVVYRLKHLTLNPGFEVLCCCFEALAISFTPRCLSSLSCVNKYLAIDSGGCVNE